MSDLSVADELLLQRSQQRLTAQKIMNWWAKMSQEFPDVCVVPGLWWDYKRTFDRSVLDQWLNTLLPCVNSPTHSTHVVATPLIQFHYEPSNRHTPHHATALMLSGMTTCSEIHMSYYNPKGRDSPRRGAEQNILQLMAKALEDRFHKPVVVWTYQGANLQARDHIGVCQLHTLYYLWRFLQMYRPQCQRSVDKNPNHVVSFIQPTNQQLVNFVRRFSL